MGGDTSPDTLVLDAADLFDAGPHHLQEHLQVLFAADRPVHALQHSHEHAEYLWSRVLFVAL